MDKKTSINGKNGVQNIASELKKYVENRVKLTILTTGEKLAKSIGDSTGKILAVPFLIIALIFLLVAFALFIGNILHNMVLGFVVASGPCLFAGILIYILAPANISRKMQDKIAEKVVDKLDTHSDDILHQTDNSKPQTANTKTKN